MRLFFALLFFCCVAPELSAQPGDPAWRLEGRVHDDNGEPVIGATIAADGAVRAVSDAKGRFAFEVPDRPGELVIRQIGYFARRIPLDTLHFDRRRAFIDLEMTASAMDLPEVGVTGKAVEVLYEEDFRSNLLDYLFAGQDLLLLVQERRRTLLRLVGDDGRKIAELELPGPATALHRSCTGGMHVFGPEWGWEVTIAGNALDTFPRYTARQFHDLIAPCVLEMDGNYVFEKMGPFRQSVQYYFYDNAQQVHPLAFIRDEIAESDLMQRYREILFAYMKTIPDVDKDDILNGQTRFTDLSKILDPDQLSKMAETNALISSIGFFQQLAEDSVYAPLFRIDSMLVLFDHVNGRLRHFQLAPFGETDAPLAYHREAGWKKEMIFDEATKRVYARFAGSGGVVVLKEIDPANGLILKKYTPSETPYLSARYRMRSGYLYCIGQPSATDPNRRLYKVNIFKDGK